MFQRAKRNLPLPDGGSGYGSGDDLPLLSPESLPAPPFPPFSLHHLPSVPLHVCHDSYHHRCPLITHHHHYHAWGFENLRHRRQMKTQPNLDLLHE